MPTHKCRPYDGIINKYEDYLNYFEEENENEN